MSGERNWRVRLTCGHVHYYPTTAHPFRGAVLHCPTCDELERAVLTEATPPTEGPA